MIYILDACAMIAYLRKETGGGLVKDALSDPTNVCVAHAINFCEVYYDIYRSSGQPDAEGAIQGLEAMGLTIRDDISADFWQAAGQLKAIHRRISLADCFAITLAQRLGGTILTSDHHEFDTIAAQGVCRVTFIR